MKTEIEEAKTFWSQNSKDYETWWVSSNDRITFWSDDLWKFMNAYKNQSQPIVKEQTNLFEIKKQVALDMGFDLNTDVYKIHFSDYTDEIAKRFASWKLKEQEQEIERLKVDNANLKTNVEYASLAFATLDNEYKELEAQKECNHEALTDTGIGYYHCPTCNKGWTYDEWNKQDQPEAQKEKDWTCYEIWRPNIPDDGCKEQCKECKQKQQNQPQPERTPEQLCEDHLKGTFDLSDFRPHEVGWLKRAFIAGVIVKSNEPQPEKAQEVTIDDLLSCVGGHSSLRIIFRNILDQYNITRKHHD